MDKTVWWDESCGAGVILVVLGLCGGRKADVFRGGVMRVDSSEGTGRKASLTRNEVDG